MSRNDEGGPAEAAHAAHNEALRRLPNYQPTPTSELETRFRIADHLADAGLYGPVSEHILFGPESGLNLCACLICRYYEDRNDTR